MTVLFLSESYRPYVSGVVRSIALTAQELAALGHRVVVAAPAYPQAAASGPDPTGAYVVRLPSAPAPGAPGFRIPFPVLEPVLHALGSRGSGEPLVLHAHGPFVAGWLGLRLRVRLGAPLVFTHHTLYHEYAHYGLLPRGMVAAWTVRAVGRFCRQVDHVVAPSGPVAALVRERYGAGVPVSVIPTGIRLEPFFGAPGNRLRAALGLEARTPVVLYVGRLAPEKNVRILLEALERILAARPDVHGVLVGGGPAEAWVRGRAGHSRQGARMHVVGTVPPEEISAWYAGADLFITASTTETQGLVAVEAMACGLPVVAPRAAGFPEVVEDGRCGLLCEPRAEALAGAALRLLREPQLRQAMGEQARRRARAYDVRQTAERLAALYARLHEARRTCPAAP